MNQADLHALEARCTQEAAPSCSAACPLSMDIRPFLAHITAGKWAEARKVLERHLPLPAILGAVCDHPCEAACLRRDLGGALAISALEQHCLAAAPRQSKLLPRSLKPKALAVLGAGMAGLVVAYDCARKGLGVTVFYSPDPSAGADMSAAVAAVLRRDFPQLPPAAWDEEWAQFAAVQVEFIAASLDQALFARARQEYDAVFVDAGAVPNALLAHLPAQQAVDATTLCVDDAAGTYCCGGWSSLSPTGARYAAAAQQAGQGRRAGISLHRMVSKVSLAAARADSLEQAVVHTDVSEVIPVPRVLPAQQHYSHAEAQSEAARCLHCECLRCVRACAFLQEHKGFPRVYARKIFGNSTVVRGTRTANVLVNGCALCGQCEAICPDNFSMAELCLWARQDLVAQGNMPQSAHEFALEDMEQAASEHCALCLPDAAHAQPYAVFFPGCQLGAVRGEQVLVLYERLRQLMPQGVGLMLNCCGVPAHWAGRKDLFEAHTAQLRAAWEGLGKPRIVTACASCQQTLSTSLPDAALLSVWEVLNAHKPASIAPSPEQGQAGCCPAPLPPVLSMQDPCGARHNAAWRNAVRSLAQSVGVQVAEPERSGEQSACCGYGGLVYTAQPATAKAMTAQRARELKHPALTSCIMCRDRLAAEGKPSWHILDILPFTAALSPCGERVGASLSARRAGRVALKEHALVRLCGKAPQPKPAALDIRIAPDVLHAMERFFILQQDVAEALLGIEASGMKFLEKESGHWVGSWRPRNVTFWVEYAREGTAYRIYKTWCHRMVVAGATQPAENVVLPQSVHA